jgi:hypothetical protein
VKVPNGAKLRTVIAQGQDKNDSKIISPLQGLELFVDPNPRALP